MLLVRQPCWVIIEKIAKYAQLISRHDKARENTEAKQETMKREKIVNFVASCVESLLIRNYKVLDMIEMPRSDPRPWFQNWLDLYPDRIAVGPLGERPLHVCALLAARYRKEIEPVADGIAKGMKSFLESEKTESSKVAGLRIYEPYRKHYSAALGFYIHTAAMQDVFNKSYPFFHLVKRWHDERISTHRKQGAVGMSGAHDSKISFHTFSTVCCGLFEGETILFPFIASKDNETVSWLLDEDRVAVAQAQQSSRQDPENPFLRCVPFSRCISFWCFCCNLHL